MSKTENDVLENVLKGINLEDGDTAGHQTVTDAAKAYLTAATKLEDLQCTISDYRRSSQI